MFDELEYKDGKLYRKGKEAGWYNKGNGYRMLSYKGEKLLTHRVVWCMHHGQWPKDVIDHINGDKLDNHIENLRDVNQTVNQYNRYNTKTSGVWFNKQTRKFRAQMFVKNKTVYLGEFQTEAEARACREAVLEKYLCSM
jgi:hypothetical protein